MAEITKRNLLTGLAQTSGLLAVSAALPNAAQGKTAMSPVSGQVPDSGALLTYFQQNARKLLRDPGGFLKYPSISPSLPHSQYSTELWDWDTLWTTQGLYRIAALSKDAALARDISEHGKGSLANFFDHQSVGGRIPMLMTVNDPDPLGCLKGTRMAAIALLAR